MTLSDIQKLLNSFNDSDITSLKLKDGEFEIKLSKGVGAESSAVVPQVVAPAPAVQIPAAAPVAPAAQIPAAASAPINCADDGCFITSPMVGTFYRAPSPGASAYVNVGDVVKKGQTVGIIEAMKIMNEIEAEFDCKIVAFEVSDGAPVEFSSNLIKVEKI